ncbi:biotin/lipoate A/B protein ligase family protein [Agrococcus sp. HG114]|uniref:lipoate--protein ligase family protein n=1 Tax=Agrococcus sp. HG114 TaxID=2969757 RepID=UPI00215B12B5|nr:biotin/lipoate A/B protein ligase family protein [Agrococcus sp. HG114]MCR8671678.1 lipoate--protein ligase family protein [Agrococcus sp. HG114]
MHGEYKVPGGKLVVVDLEERDGRIADFRLAGDFFLEPDDALGTIDAAVNGLPATASAVEIGEAIKAALPKDAVLLGFTPESVGVAIRRALQHASTFGDYAWTIIDDEPRLPIVHVALDEVLTEAVGAGRRGPTLRFWNLSGPAVYLGSFQSYRNEVDPENAERHGIPVLRRITGGGAMFSEPDNAITYSLYVPGDLVQGMSFQDSYAFLDAWVIEALKGLGIEAFYAPLNDISSTKGKIGGAAQKRLASGAVLHHATMSYDIDAAKMTEVLRIGKEKLSDKGTTSAKKRVDPLKSQTGMGKAEVQEALKATFRRLYGGTDGALTADELAEAEERIRTKFATEQWLHRVP